MTNDDLKRLYEQNANSTLINDFVRYDRNGMILLNTKATANGQVVNYETLIEHTGGAGSQLNYKGEWTSGDTIHRYDVVYEDFSAYKSRIYYIATNDIASSTIPPHTDTSNWSEYLEVPLPMAQFITLTPETPGATSGTLTDSELVALQKSENVGIMFNNELFMLQSKGFTAGQLVYSMQEYESSNFTNKIMTVNTTTKAWNYREIASGTVDQSYNPVSINAQSGVAVAQALSGLTGDNIKVSSTDATYISAKLTTLTSDVNSKQSNILTNIPGNANQVLARNSTNDALIFVDQTGGGEPAEYIKSATINGNQITFVNKAGTSETYNPTIPTKTSDLTNDSNFVNQTDLQNGLSTREVAGACILKTNIANDLVTTDTNKVLSAPQGKLLNETKADKVTITKDTTSTTVTQELANNTSYRYTQELTSLAISFPTMTDEYQSELVFKSGTTATTFSTSATIKWSGDDVASNAFTPVASKTYEIMLWYNGIDINAIVRGV